MSTADRIDRERRAKRALILDAARELFAARGIEAVTLREVAQRIEHSTTAIYVHFKDKQDLVDQMVREDFERFGAALAAVASVRDPMERLDQLGQAYVRFALTMPRHYQLLFMTPPAGPPLARGAGEPDPGIAGFEAYELLLATVRECIATGRLRAEHTDPAAVAQVVWAWTHGLVSLLIAMGRHPKFEWRAADVLARTGLGAMMRGLAREAATDPPARAARRAPRPRPRAPR